MSSISKSRLSIFLIGFSFAFLHTEQILGSPKTSINTVGLVAQKSFVTEAVQLSGPAVVTVETKRTVVSRNSVFPPNFFIDPSFERFFSQRKTQPPVSRIQQSQGSGVIFSSSGLVLTNAHVVEKAELLTIGLSDGRRFSGKVIGQDKLTDLAVIKIQGKGPWPIAPLGNSDNLVVGDWAIAVGNPFGLEKTVTLGIISNLNRNVSQLGISDKRLKLIQTDAAINPGNSGGPLLNAKGEVIGINTLVRSGPGAGLGFAIPINQATKIANQLVNVGKAIHPMVGVNLAYLMPNDIRDSVILSGAKVVYVIPNSPAEREGLKINDIIVYVNSVKVKDPDDVVDEINRVGVGKNISFVINRNNMQIKLNIKPVDINQFKLN